MSQAKPRDEWKEVWDWAAQVWAAPEGDYSFHHFFRSMASQRAKAEGWEELGSSDVWHTCFYTVKSLMERGTVKTREDLQKQVRDNMGCY